ncbi:MAG: hypothetical protein HY791_37475 [Deltaproteobacteria bacterium]|nr:hypothetical protein [Deltaproteobacteria bacterium]
MSQEKSENQLDAAARREGPEFFVQFVRALRVTTVHELENETAKSVLNAFTEQLGAFHRKFGQVQVQVVGSETYFNGVFVRRKGPAIEASAQATEIYQKLGISEIAFDRVPPPAETRRFFEVFQRHYRSKTPTAFTKEVFSGIRVRIAEEGAGKGKDSRGKVADLYAELAAMVRDARHQADRGESVSLALLRRGIQELADAGEQQKAVLAGLTRLDLPEMFDGLHATAVAVLVTLMCEKLGIPKRELMQLALGAIVLDLSRREWPTTSSDELESIRQVSLDAVRNALSLSSAEVVERACLAFENNLPVEGDPDELLPTMGARIVRTASVYQILTMPPPPHRGLRTDQALSILLSARRRFDVHVVRLLAAAIGEFPVGSIVKLSTGRVGVVASIPEAPTRPDRPQVRMVQPKDGKAETVDLGKQPDSVKIVETLDDREKKLNPVRFLLS